MIKGLFQHAPFSFHGHYYALCDVSLQPEQQHRPPFLIGGGGRRMLALAARKADIVSINSQMTADGGFDMASLAPEVMAGMKRLGSHQDCANVCDFFISPASDNITGQVIYLGGVT